MKKITLFFPLYLGSLILIAFPPSIKAQETPQTQATLTSPCKTNLSECSASCKIKHSTQEAIAACGVICANTYLACSEAILDENRFDSFPQSSSN